MTQSTEQERADFEAWAIENNKYHVSGYNPHSDLWDAWQAARRAQVVTPTVDQVSEAVGYHSSAWDCIDPKAIIDAVMRLAAAPQQPTALSNQKD